MLGVCLSVEAMAQGAFTFDANAGVKSKMTLYDGTEVNFTAYERLFYVTNVEDSTYQYLNVYVPDGATQRTPIFLRTYVWAAIWPRPQHSRSRTMPREEP